MAWTSPMTFTDDMPLTAAQLNTFLRDNFLETMPAKATQASTFFAVDANNHLVERNPGRDSNQTSSNRSNTEYGDLNDPTASPTVTRTTGPTCLVMWRAQMSPTAAADRTGYVSVEIQRTNSEIGGVPGELGSDDATEGIEPADKYSVCNQNSQTNLYSGTAFMMFHNLIGEEEGDSDEERAFEYQFSLKYRTVGGEIAFNRKSIFVWPFS
jgi:hypothetical protein